MGKKRVKKQHRNDNDILLNRMETESMKKNDKYNGKITKTCSEHFKTSENGKCPEQNIPGSNQEDNESGIFPIGTEWLVFFLTLCFRIRYVSRKENWWILHPDEIFQSVEGQY